MTHEITITTNHIYQYLTKFRIAARRQITALCGDTAATEEALAAMIRLRRVGQKTMEITSGKYADVIYLKAAGIKPATAANKKIAYLIRVGLPKGSMLNRMYHELLVVESLCWYKKMVDVFDFYTEDELKAYGENPADLRIHFCQKNGELATADCEIVVKNSAKQIAAKSRDMVFFTPSQTRADRIEYEKKCSVIVLDITYNPPAEIERVTGEEQVQIACVDMLNQTQNALTSGALSALTGIDRARISAAINHDRFHFRRASVRIDLDASAGRPEVIFSTYLSNFASYSERVFHLLTSRLIEKSARTSAKLTGINSIKRTVLFEINEENHLFYVDDPLADLIDSIGKYAILWDDLEQCGDMTTYFIPSNSARYFETMALMQEIRLADLVLARDFRF